jgi:hypothetical protein
VQIDPRLDVAIQTAIGAMTAAILSEGAKVSANRTRIGYRLTATTHSDGMRHVVSLRVKSVMPRTTKRRGGPLRIRQQSASQSEEAQE